MRSLPALLVLTVPSLLTAQSWRRLQVDASPPPASVAMAYDSDRSRAVLVSTELPLLTSLGVVEAQTWERRADRWVLRDDVATPSDLTPRLAMCYDRGQQRLVACATSGQTWAFDGSVWEPLPTMVPTTVVSNDPSLAYDEARDVVVMTDGGLFYELVNDSWVEPGNQTPLTLNNLRLWSARIAFHPPTGLTVLFGGRTHLGQPSDDTYLWDGQSVVQATPSTVPGARSQQAMTTDPATGRVVMLGGRGQGNPTTFGDVFEWDGSDWLPTAAMPRPRLDHSAAFDRGNLLVYGGRDGPAANPAPVLDVRQNGSWSSTVTERGAALAAHDPVRLRTVGVDETTTREFDGYRWTDTGVPPPAAGVTALGWHGSTARIVAVAGDGSTWLWDGVSWTAAPGAATVIALPGAATSYDPIRDRLILFSGVSNGSPVPWTREWDGTSWTTVPPAGAPLSLPDPTMCWNPATGRTFMWPGTDSDCYEWDGSSWTTISTNTPLLAEGRLGYDPVLGIVLVGRLQFANNTEGSFVFDGTTWNLGPASPTHLALGGPLVFDLNRGSLMMHDWRESRDLMLDASGAAIEAFGSGCAGSNGTPRLDPLASAGLGELMALDALDHAVNAPLLLLAANAEADVLLPGGCRALVDQPVVAAAATASSNGYADFTFKVPRQPSVVGLSLFFQSVSLDAAGSLFGLASLSNGVSFRLGG